MSRVLAVLDLLSAALLALGVFVGLPDRWLFVDVPAVVLAALFAGSGIGLLGGWPWASRFARITAAVALGTGLLLVALLAIAASYLFGIYGPVGQGGALIYVLVLGLVVPYLVVLPLVQFLWLGRPHSNSDSDADSAPPRRPVSPRSEVGEGGEKT